MRNYCTMREVINATAQPLAAGLALAAAGLMCAIPGLLGIQLLPLLSSYECGSPQRWEPRRPGALVAVRNRTVAVPRSVLPRFGLLAVLALQVALGKLAYTQQATLAMPYTVFAMTMAWCELQLREVRGLERASRVIVAAPLAGGVLSALLALAQAHTRVVARRFRLAA